VADVTGTSFHASAELARRRQHDERRVVDIETRRRRHAAIWSGPDLYDWADERPGRAATVDRSVARYALEQLAAVTHPQHPAAHADAIRALTEALEP